MEVLPITSNHTQFIYLDRVSFYGHDLVWNAFLGPALSFLEALIGK